MGLRVWCVVYAFLFLERERVVLGFRVWSLVLFVFGSGSRTEALGTGKTCQP